MSWFKCSYRIAALVAVAVTIPVGGVTLPRAPVVEIAQGRLAGTIERGDIRVFRNIPYATAERWKPPIVAQGWTGVRDATQAGPACFQPGAQSGLYADSQPNMSEDCLSLNVWAPPGARKAPMMVWIHGGALWNGRNASPAYDGARLAAHGVVVVVINYRLGVLGYMAHPALSRESPRGVSGNYGLLDQVEALRWVRRNAAAFGGDPGNVTIAGESAGALSVAELLVSPLARGLFAKAIAESSYLVSLPELKNTSHGTPAAEAVGLRIAEAAKAPDIAALRAIDPARLTALAIGTGYAPLPTIDGWAMPRQFVEALDRGEQARVPVIAGFNAGEIRSLRRLMPLAPADGGGYAAQIRDRYRDVADRYLALYPASDVEESMLAGLRDAMYGWSADRLAKAQARIGVPAYLYYFDHGYPAAEARKLHGFHASEVPFVFGNIDAAHLSRNWPVPDGPGDAALAEAMMDYWTSFAKTGVPRAAGAAAWPRYDGYLRFADTPVADARLSTDAFALHEEVVRRRRADGGQPWTTNFGLASPPVPPATPTRN